MCVDLGGDRGLVNNGGGQALDEERLLEAGGGKQLRGGNTQNFQGLWPPAGLLC